MKPHRGPPITLGNAAAVFSYLLRLRQPEQDGFVVTGTERR
jgi:hypothetical protein